MKHLTINIWAIDYAGNIRKGELIENRFGLNHIKLYKTGHLHKCSPRLCSSTLEGAKYMAESRVTNLSEAITTLNNFIDDV